jgi:hypothetical protein
LRGLRLKSLKTDNSHFWGKVRLREEMIKELTEINVLDLYSGYGTIWNTIKERNKDKKINVTAVEKVKGKNPDAIEADALKLIPIMDLSKYDVIDIDVYGNPYKPLKAVVKNGSFKDGVIIFLTDIRVGYGAVPTELLLSIGFTEKQIKKVPTLFYKFEPLAIFNYLYELGVKKVLTFKPTYNKIYIGFKLERRCLWET